MPGPVEGLLAELDQGDNPAVSVVLADALLEAGDPRGELIQRQHCGDAEAAAALIATHSEALIGLPNDAEVELDWRLGFPVTARLPWRPPVSPPAHDARTETLKTLLTHPGGRFVRTLLLRGPRQSIGPNSVNTTLAALDGVSARQIRSLQLGEGHKENRRYWVQYWSGVSRLTDDLTGLWQRFPALETLRVDLGATSLHLGPIEAPCLRRFEWVAPWVRPDQLEAFVTPSWPNLEHFVLWTGREILVDRFGDLYGTGPLNLSRDTIRTPEPLIPLLNGLDSLAKLTTFGIANYAGSWGDLATVCSLRPFWQRLRTLDLSHATLEDAEIDRLIKAIRAGSLRQVRMDGVTASDQARGALRAEFALVGDDVPSSTFHYVLTQE